MQKNPQVIIFGPGRFGTSIGTKLQHKGVQVLGIDFNPSALKEWQSQGLTTKFGDATDPQFLSDLHLEGVQWILCTVPINMNSFIKDDARITLIQNIRDNGHTGKLAVVSHPPAETQNLLEHGADLVLDPYEYASDKTVDLVLS